VSSGADAAEQRPFGALLREHRLAAGLTQEELAERAGLSARSVQGLERGASRPFPDTVRRLTGALALPPAAAAAVAAAARAVPRPGARGAPAGGPPSQGEAIGAWPGGAPPRPAPREPPSVPHNLPAPLTALVGREGQAEDVARTLAASRLVTLTGPGGCGKTRLALEVGATLTARAPSAAPGAGDPPPGAGEGGGAEAFPDGVWLAELAALADPALVPQVVAAAVGVREAPGHPLLETLGRALRPRRLLLVLDNCEHLRPACAALADALLRAAPNARVLATSRQALGIAGEVAWWVPPLAWPAGPAGALLPPAALPPPAALLRYGAVRLFAERAAAARPGFVLTEENAPAVLQLCARLDGLPLALELAARQAVVLPVEQLAARLDGRFRLLTGGSPAALPRQQTLRATVDWSHDLLGESERALFRRLSVFAGGFSLAAAEAVCADPEGGGLAADDVLGLLFRLVDASLVVAGPEPAVAGAAGPAGRGDGPARYRLLETLRQYAAERLAGAAEEEGAVRARHRDWCLALAAAAAPALAGPEAAAWLARLAPEHDNLRAALGWCAEHAPESGLRLTVDLGPFWRARAHYAEASRWLARLLERAPGGPAGGAARSEALTEAASLALHQWDLAEARGRLAEALALCRAAGDDRLLARALRVSGNLHIFAGDPPGARRPLEEALALCRAAGDRRGLADALLLLGVAAQDSDDLPQARALLEESLVQARTAGDQSLISTALWLAGRVSLRLGDLDGAGRTLAEGLGVAWTLGQLSTVTRLQEHLARVAYARGDLAGAAGWHEAGLALARETADEHAVAMHLAGLGRVAQAQGEADRAVRLLEDGLARFERLLDRRWIAAARHALALAVWSAGDAPRARALLRESLAARRDLGDREGVAACLEGLAALAAAAGDAGGPARAAPLLGAAATLREHLHTPLPAPDRTRHEATVARARADLGDVAWVAAEAAGRELPLAEAIAAALAEPAPSPAAP
jgi:predicted ATPase/DNA-binding XRE family transcriptional regulator